MTLRVFDRSRGDGPRRQAAMTVAWDLGLKGDPDDLAHSAVAINTGPFSGPSAAEHHGSWLRLVWVAIPDGLISDGLIGGMDPCTGLTGVPDASNRHPSSLNQVIPLSASWRGFLRRFPTSGTPIRLRTSPGMPPGHPGWGTKWTRRDRPR